MIATACLCLDRRQNVQRIYNWQGIMHYVATVGAFPRLRPLMSIETQGQRRVMEYD